MTRELRAGEVYIMMLKDSQTVRLYSYDSRSCCLYEKRFDKGYKFMKVSREDNREAVHIYCNNAIVSLGLYSLKY